VRRSPTAEDEVRWDPAGESVAPEVLEGVDAVVHLAGKGIADARWTKSVKAEVWASRVHSTKILAEAMTASGPRVFVCASATGIFGDRGDELLDEESAPGDDFLSELCSAWESAADPARDRDVRVVHGRLGMVLTCHGGALAKMLPIFRVGGGGRLASGRQFVPYISREDAVAAFLRLIDDPGLVGPVHVTAETPATNTQHTRALGAALNRPTFMPVPLFALRLAFGEFADAIVASQRAVPKRLLDAGFVFKHRTIEDAMRAALDE
jgi:uncharacterized protein (TIGR01777 family)